MSETILGNVRVIAIDQEIAQGGRPVSATISKQAQTVSLELTPDQVKKVTVAKQLGKLSLAVRAAVDQWSKASDKGAVSSCDVSPELARQNAIAGQHTEVMVHSGGEVKQYSVRKQVDDGDGLSCEGSSEAARDSATAVAAKVLEKR
jgi:pilus assembly protein CpaB